MTPRMALVLAATLLATVATPAPAADPPATMRLDYFHTGGQGAEIYSVDRTVIEPLPTPWPKEELEAREREFQARRKQIRAEGRPESEMSALFREEQVYTTHVLGAASYAGKVGAFQGALDRVIDLYAGPAGRN
jgi:hypothetical protein